jgi:hypothetical protein
VRESFDSFQLYFFSPVHGSRLVTFINHISPGSNGRPMQVHIPLVECLFLISRLTQTLVTDPDNVETHIQAPCGQPMVAALMLHLLRALPEPLLQTESTIAHAASVLRTRLYMSKFEQWSFDLDLTGNLIPDSTPLPYARHNSNSSAPRQTCAARRVVR